MLRVGIHSEGTVWVNSLHLRVEEGKGRGWGGERVERGKGREGEREREGKGVVVDSTEYREVRR